MLDKFPITCPEGENHSVNYIMFNGVKQSNSYRTVTCVVSSKIFQQPLYHCQNKKFRVTEFVGLDVFFVFKKKID